MVDDFPVTRRTIERLDAWLNALASPLLPLQRVPFGAPELGGFQWAFHEQTARALAVGKAVRMISGIRSALALADAGHVAECGTILRTVSDFAHEVIAIYEASAQGGTTAEKRFIRQYFASIPTSPDEYEAQVRERWVTRDELFAGHYTTANKLGFDADRLRKVVRFLAYGYDKFVHGAYVTSMELYDPRTNRFMLRGHESEGKRREFKRAIASKLHELLTALVLMAIMMNMSALVKEITRAADDLMESGEPQSASASD